MTGDQIVTSLDQALLLSEPLVIALTEADAVVDRAVVTGRPELAWDHIHSLRQRGQTSALGIAKVLYEMRSRWPELRDQDTANDIGPFPPDDTFEDAASAGTGLSIASITDYLDVWQYVIENEALTDEQRIILMGKPMSALKLLIAAAKQQQLTEVDWKKLALAPDVATIRELVRLKRGSKTSSEMTLYIMLESRGVGKGTLKARLGSSGNYVEFGFLNMDRQEKAAQAAIERILREAGVFKR